jgi:hypothetical protein
VSSLEEGAKYAALTAAPHSADGLGGGLHLPSWLYARISVAVVSVAVAVSCAVEAAQVLAYARAVEASAGRAQLGSSLEAAQLGRSSSDPMKAEAWGGD